MPAHDRRECRHRAVGHLVRVLAECPRRGFRNQWLVVGQRREERDTGMSGGQLAELLSERYSAMKVLFVSGYSEKVVLRHKILDVQTNFLQKPFTLKSLAAKIREVLGHVLVSTAPQ